MRFIAGGDWEVAGSGRAVRGGRRQSRARAKRKGSRWRLPKNGQNAVDNEGEKNQKKPD